MDFPIPLLTLIDSGISARELEAEVNCRIGPRDAVSIDPWATRPPDIERLFDHEAMIADGDGDWFLEVVQLPDLELRTGVLSIQDADKNIGISWNVPMGRPGTFPLRLSRANESASVAAEVLVSENAVARWVRAERGTEAPPNNVMLFPSGRVALADATEIGVATEKNLPPRHSAIQTLDSGRHRWGTLWQGMDAEGQLSRIVLDLGGLCEATWATIGFGSVLRRPLGQEPHPLLEQCGTILEVLPGADPETLRVGLFGLAAEQSKLSIPGAKSSVIRSGPLDRDPTIGQSIVQFAFRRVSTEHSLTLKVWTGIRPA